MRTGMAPDSVKLSDIKFAFSVFYESEHNGVLMHVSRMDIVPPFFSTFNKLQLVFGFSEITQPVFKGFRSVFQLIN